MHSISFDPARFRLSPPPPPPPRLFLSPSRIPTPPTIHFSQTFPSLSLCSLHQPHVNTVTKLYGHSGQNEAEAEGEAEAEKEVSIVKVGQLELVKKVYGTLLAQLLLTALAYLAAAKYPLITTFVQANPGVPYAVLGTAALSSMSLFTDSKTHLFNLILLGLLSITMCVSAGVYLANMNGKIVLQSLFLTSALVSTLTCYTFRASKMNNVMGYLRAFLPASLVFIIVFGLVQVLYPMGSFPNALYNGVAGILFSAWVTHDTHRLLHAYAPEEYVKASFQLSLAMFLVFFDVLGVLSFWLKL